LSLNLIDKRDTGSGTKHRYCVYLPYVSVTEDSVAHNQFSTFERTRGDTNGHLLPVYDRDVEEFAMSLLARIQLWLAGV
jgi:hypothetical protein